MNETNEILEKYKEELAQVDSPDALSVLWRKYLGNVGLVKAEIKNLSILSLEEKKVQGPEIQHLQKTVQEMYDDKRINLDQLKMSGNLKEQAEELGFITPKVGHLHPITQTIRQMNKLFEDIGFSVMDGPEIEKDEFCFQRLNVPLDHPARDMQDTIYIEEPNWLLRTQTSSVEARILSEFQPPFKVVSPGRVYRNEKVNSSNHFIFHHYQGLVVLEKATLKDLFGTFNMLFEKMYGPDVVVRYRNKYYPEVEPGVGPDMQCFNCKGKGCSLCKGVGWIEMGGAGIIHPNVLKTADIDPVKWMGFAFGLGLDRWVMAKYNITDIRTLLGGNLAYRYYENENTL